MSRLRAKVLLLSINLIMWISSQNEVLPKCIIRVFGVLLGVMTLPRTLPRETYIQVGTLFTYLYNVTNRPLVGLTYY